MLILFMMFNKEVLYSFLQEEESEKWQDLCNI